MNSPVFEGMFLNNTRERHTGKIKIKDISADVMQILIIYFHSGKLFGLDTYAEDLYIVADKYAINKLEVSFYNIRSLYYLENLY
jgi:hypothetical protein